MINILYKYSALIFFLLLVSYSAKVNWKDGQWEHVLEADAKGYYAYLPATFVYHDLNFGFFDTIEKKATNPLFYDYRSFSNGKFIDKYYIGTAICISPFYLTAHLFNHLFFHDKTGYGYIYIVFLTIATCFYTALGLFFLKKILTYYSDNKLHIIITLGLIIFSTNLFYYTIGEPGFSHAYSFCFFSIFIYLILNFFKNLNYKFLVWSALVLGLIILIRPVNAIIVFSIPFLSGSYRNLENGIKSILSNYKLLISCLLLILVFPSIQFIIYKIQTGEFIVYSYGEEGFNFLKTKFISFLFSYKKGFFLYTPIAFVALLGLFNTNLLRFQKACFLAFIVLVIYLMSSWWMWYYGGSFSSRVMVEYLPFFGITLLMLVDLTRNKIYQLMIYLTLTFLLLVNQIQTLQYRYFIIHWSEMTKEKYWNVFLDLSPVVKRNQELKK